MAKAPGQAGYDFEELLRAYFLRAGFFVLRGVPLKFDGDDATDIDVWLYERPTGTLRRRQAVDAKFKSRPKAAERILWTRGLQTALGLDGCFVATTDRRSSLRVLAKMAGVSLFDGDDLERIRRNPRVLFDDRLTEEQFAAQVKAVDSERRSREVFDTLQDLKSTVATIAGAPLINRALDAFAFFARGSAVSHQHSEAARTLGRLSFLAASLVAIGLDFVDSEEPFRSSGERRESLLSAIRYGASDRATGVEKLRLAEALARKYAANGAATANQIASGYAADLAAIPAEIVADHAVKMGGDASLFNVARSLEAASYHIDVPNFDQLATPLKSFLGSLLDFSDVGRVNYASAWTRSATYRGDAAESGTREVGNGDLFGRP